MLKQTFIHSLWERNAFSVQLLGLCPALAVSFNLENATGLAIASSFVLISTSLTISMVRKFIPAEVRLPFFVLVIATLTTGVTLAMQALAWELYIQVALFVQIIVTNCMILGHVETTASKERVLTSLISALGTSIGFSVALILLGAIRQALSPFLSIASTSIGAFLVVGVVLALNNHLQTYFNELKTVPWLRREGKKTPESLS